MFSPVLGLPLPLFFYDVDSPKNLSFNITVHVYKQQTLPVDKQIHNPPLFQSLSLYRIIFFK